MICMKRFVTCFMKAPFSCFFFSRGWFSADTKEEQLEWMEKLNQVLLDVHTWSRAPQNPVQTTQTEETPLPVKASSSSRTIRESSL